jgi:putative transposase
MHTGRPGRLRHFSYVGFHRYFLTFCTSNRLAVFTEARIVALVWEQIQRAAARETMAILAYCFMPDHLHLLIEGGAASSDARRFISGAKQRSGFAYMCAIGGRLWQPYAYERVLRRGEQTLPVARYIVHNPVRAGLVASPIDYPCVGSGVCDLRELIEAVRA